MARWWPDQLGSTAAGKHLLTWPTNSFFCLPQGTQGAPGLPGTDGETGEMVGAF